MSADGDGVTVGESAKGLNRLPAATPYWPEDEDGPDRTCTWCGGDGVAECDDPIQCLDPACNGEMCTCLGCNGRGYDQVVW